jgi:hypothetical protein
MIRKQTNPSIFVQPGNPVKNQGGIIGAGNLDILPIAPTLAEVLAFGK